MIPPTMCPRYEKPKPPSILGRPYRLQPLYPGHHGVRVDVIAEERDTVTIRAPRNGVTATVTRARFDAAYSAAGN
jgi:hypothetical protein